MHSRQAFFQRVSASLIVPITFLPLAAILLAIGNQLGIGPVEAAGLALIRFWLPLFFAIGISVGFTENDAMGALSVATGYLVMTAVAEKVSGDPALNVGVLGGIVVGAACTWIYNRVKNVSLPEYLALFSGKRMGPMVAAVGGVALGYAFGYAWPPIYHGIVVLGQWLYSSGGVGVFAYGAILRLLIPTGLHHILMNLIDTQIGGWIEPTTGKQLAGEYVRFLAGDPSAGRILSGFFLTLGFGPAGAALAIVREARPAQRRKVAGLMLTGALTAVLLGVTEPVEFAFIFASPLLFGVHVVLSGLGSLVAWLLNIHMGGYALPMMLINWHRQQNGLLLIPLGLLWTALYYYSFRAVIRWKRPMILGQVPAEDVAEETAAVEPVAASEEGRAFLDALGGKENIVQMEACMTRLRMVVKEPRALDEERLKRLGARGIMNPGGGDVQVVVGARAGEIEGKVRAAMGGAPASTAAAPVLAPAPARATGAPARATGAPARATGAPAAPSAGAPCTVTLVSPLTGRILPLEQVPDPVFAGGLAGQGVAVEATDGVLAAPADGTVSAIFPGGHALAIVTPEGLELLVHVGLETVTLKGEGFALAVAEGARVQAGAPLGRFDPALIARHGKSLISPVLITNAERVHHLHVLADKHVRAGEPLLEVELKPSNMERPPGA